MLKHLYIRNFVLIDELEVDFDSGLSVITGETGAGKSILFGALSLLKGKRADLSEMKDQSNKSIIEARIDVSKYKLRREFEAENLDYLDEAIFRRELSPQGKTRAFINDTPVKLEQMQALGELLFDIHSQHQSIRLNEAEYRLSMIDELSGSKLALEAFQKLYFEARKVEKGLNELKENARQAIQEEDYLQFQFEELDNLNIKEGEEKELEDEQSLLANAEQIISLTEQVSNSLDSEESQVLSNIHYAGNKLEELSRLNPSMSELSSRLKSAYLELSDIHSELESFKDNFDFDGKRLQFLEERMADLHRLKHKHGFDSADDLIPFKEQIESKLQSIGSFSEEIEAAEELLSKITKELLSAAQNLSVTRSSSLLELQTSICATLKKLGMPNAQFNLRLESVPINKMGIDKVYFEFSANSGMELQDVRKIASGGELSRIMLAIKRELAGKKQMPALLFDEIDTGVSGEVADQLGNILKEMSNSHQIMSITHLPQLAAKGRSHYYVYKDQDSLGLTKTHVRKLSSNERVEELAKMLSGEKVSDAAINNAKDLLAQ